jgi:catalase
MDTGSMKDLGASLFGMKKESKEIKNRDAYYTTSDGRPLPSLTSGMKIGAHPVQSDAALLEKQQSFDRMKIQERIVHPAGSSALGKFTVTHDVSHLTKAKLFQPGEVTPAYTRFSTVTVGREYPDSARNPRGFATKFYTADGNYDLVGLNWPIFFVREPWHGVDNIRSQQRDPASFLIDYSTWLDFLAGVPESMHAGTMLLSDHGTPKGWRYMNGFGCHTFSWINEQGESTYGKYHWLSQQGTVNMTMDEATKLCGQDPDFAKRDLWQHIAGGGKCEWQLCVQTMTQSQADGADFDPFDVTKVWPRRQFGMQPVGTLTLDRNPQNYFRDVEQVAFSPGSLVPGIGPSPDSLLLWRMFFYRDAQYHRLGVNLHQIPVNCPFMATSTNSDNFDGAMRIDENNKGKPQYMPSVQVAKQGPEFDTSSVEAPMPIGGKSTENPTQLKRTSDNFRHRGQTSEYDQVRFLWKNVMSQQERENTCSNTATLANMCPNVDIMKNCLVQCYAISPDYAEGIHSLLAIKGDLDMQEIKAGSQTAHLVNVTPEHSISVQSDTSFMGMRQCPYKFS